MVIFTILILVIFFAARRLKWIVHRYKKIITEPYNYYALLVLLVIGFIGRLDYTDRLGCIVGEEPIFEIKNIIFSSISVTLIITSLLIRSKRLKITLGITELAFWVFKLFYFKGGYLVSIVAAPDPIVSFYDTLTLSFRLFIIDGLLRSNINTIYILIITLTIIAIKVYIYPAHFSLFVE